jgi:hypothetical protein
VPAGPPLKPDKTPTGSIQQRMPPTFVNR